MPRLLSVVVRLSHHFLSFQLHTVANPVELATILPASANDTPGDKRINPKKHTAACKPNQIKLRNGKKTAKQKKTYVAAFGL